MESLNLVSLTLTSRKGVMIMKLLKLLALLMFPVLVACNEADIASANLSKAADMFEVTTT